MPYNLIICHFNILNIIGYNLQTVFYIIFLANMQVKRLPIYYKFQKTIQKTLEKETITRLKLYQKLWNVKNGLCTKPDNHLFT